jgi:sortase A
MHQSRAVAAYTRQVAQLTEEDYSQYWCAARAYNRALAQSAPGCHLSEQQKAQYSSLLNITGDGIMGYLEIPAIHCSLPIRHGADESVLQTSAGHIEWSSLPIGGESSHCVISGHRGLPSAKLFTHLDKLAIGDTFHLHVLDEVLTYEVDQILTVLPSETEALQIVPGQDFCTLVTCTPYAVNTHRLLVRGCRVEEALPAPSPDPTPPDTEEVPPAEPTATAQRPDPSVFLLALFSLPFLLCPRDEKEQ